MRPAVLRRAQRHRCLRDREIEEEPQHDDFALSRRQATNGLSHCVALDHPLDLIADRLAPTIGIRKLGWTATQPASAVAGQVHKHSMGVGVWRFAGRSPPLSGPQERRLKEILGVPTVAG